MSYSVSHQEALETGDLDRVNLDEVTQLLQDPSVDPTASDNEAIRRASGDGNLSVVNRLLQDERVDPTALDNYAIRWAFQYGHLAVVDRLLQHPLVNATCLHTNSCIYDEITTAAAAGRLSLTALQRLSATLTLPFPADSRILAWQSRICAYREQAVALAGEVTALHGAGGGVSGEVMDDIVWVYCFGLRLPQYCALDSL
jgi:hypothetical protein